MKWLRWLLSLIFGPSPSFEFDGDWGEWENIHKAETKPNRKVRFGGDGFLMLKGKERQEWRNYKVKAHLTATGHPGEQPSVGVCLLVKYLGRGCPPRYPWMKALDFLMAEVWWYRLILRGPTKGQNDWDYNVMNPAVEHVEFRRGCAGEMTIQVKADHEKVTMKVLGPGNFAQAIQMPRDKAPKEGTIALMGNNMDVVVHSLKVESV